MDPVSQGVLGAVAAGAAARSGEHRRALVAGAASAMMADLDVLIRSQEDPLLSIEYHRHFTHALIFIPVGALVASLLFSLLLRGSSRLPFPRLYAYSFLGYATAGLLDACTSYGTLLLWPFSHARIAWNNISIIDPLFTGPLITLVALHFWRRRRLWSQLALAFAIAYLLLGVLQRNRAASLQEELIAQRGHADGATKLTVKPSIANLILWRSIYAYEGKFFIDALRVPALAGSASVFPGSAVQRVDVQELLAKLPSGSDLAHDLRRFDHFSDGYLAWHPRHPEVLADIRYATLPDSPLPIWGIEIDFDDPTRHSPMLYFREVSVQDRERLLDMLFGQPARPADAKP